MGLAQDHDPGSDQQHAAARQALEAELQRLVDSGEYAAWFRKLAALRRYSARNQIWILVQRPDATRCASYRVWRQVGRQVRKGETGIRIFHPKPYWIDPATGRKVPPPRTEHDRARLEQRIAWSIGHTFDISQTDGEPLELGRPPPDQAPAELAAHLDGYCTTNGVTVDMGALPAGLDGYYQRDPDRIVLNTALNHGGRIATLAHELAHREDPVLAAADAAGDRSYYRHNRPDCEAVAEAAAHTISARFGLDLTRHSAGYIAGWIDGDVNRFRQLHDRVGTVCSRLVPPDRLDRALDAARAAVIEQAAHDRRSRAGARGRRR